MGIVSRKKKNAPLIRVDVYDRYAELRGQGTRKVAEVTSDGTSGKLVVLDPALAGMLQQLFERSTTRRVPVGGDAGAPAEEALVVMKPFTEAALRHAVERGLPAMNLRGVFVPPQPSTRNASSPSVTST